MAVRLYNTLTRRVEELVPRDPGRVGVYCCGPTVYDVPHAGHARAALVPDLLVRRLRSLGLAVTYVRNITDVDDKILMRAKENGEPPLELSRRMTAVYQEQMRALGCLDPDVEPRVSEHLEPVYTLIRELLEANAAYFVERPDGTRDVYFSVRSFPTYGKLSRRNIDELVAGARVDRDEAKRDPLDFALWKGAKPDEWGWDGPFGRGRPGWHIECSAMSTTYLGHGFDVHAGGMDLIFPHHENEIAQSEAARPNAGPFARVWLHNGFVNVDKEKMSKSLGNFVTITDVLERNDPEAFRWFLLGAQYRGPIQFEVERLDDGRVVFPNIDEAERRVDHLYGVLERLEEIASREAPAASAPELEPMLAMAARAEEEVGRALDDDLNTPVALAALGEIARAGGELAELVHKRRKDERIQAAAPSAARRVLESLRRAASLLGVLVAAPGEYRERTRARRLRVRGLTKEAIDARVEERTAARKAKDFARGDQIRNELTALGVAVHDGPAGTTWSVLP
ncbi:MAG TPA: cysteine--tRNA ligase [Polyangiaceae bacterium]|nr:cysteine--tRNA ligase [Polyangiaceae bacterium]